MPKKEESAIKKVSLRQFIDENYRLFTAMGVVGGLAALFTRLENAEYLSFMSFLMLILMDFELWVAFPKSEEASITLTVFEWTSQMFLIMVGVYICATYTTFVLQLLPVLIFIVFAGIFIILNRKFKPYKYVRKITSKDKWYSPTIRGLVAITAIIVIFFLASVVASYIINLVNSMF